MTPDLGTTNLLLGVMAAVSLLEALAVIGLFVGGFLLYRRVMQVVAGLEERHVAPATARVNSILDDIKTVSADVRSEADRMDRIVRWGIEAWQRRRQQRETTHQA